MRVFWNGIFKILTAWKGFLLIESSDFWQFASSVKTDCIFVLSVLQIWIPYPSEVVKFHRLLKVECVVYSYQWSMIGIHSSMRTGRTCLRTHQWGKTTFHFKLETIPTPAMTVLKMIISDWREGEVRKKWELEEPRNLEEWRGVGLDLKKRLRAFWGHFRGWQVFLILIWGCIYKGGVWVWIKNWFAWKPKD